MKSEPKLETLDLKLERIEQSEDDCTMSKRLMWPVNENKLINDGTKD